MQQYKPRITDKLLDFKLHSKGAVVIDGPKWCGKTTSAKQFAKSEIAFGDTNDAEQNIAMAEASLSAVIEGDTPRLFDEWQEVPLLWDALRYEIDRRNTVGQFILTGSSIKIPKNTKEDLRRHSGTGRFTYLFMRPMSLFESGESNGKISLASLFDEQQGMTARCKLNLNDIAFLSCRGGYPFSTFLEGEYALSQARDYYESIIREDISRVDGIRRDPEVAAKLMRSYAREIAQAPSLESIAKDVTDVSYDTVSSYLNALRRIYIVEDAEAWNPNLRSKTAIRTANTRYFVDPSIAVAALGLNPDGLIGDMKYFGYVFEAMVFRDLRVYASALNGVVYHYRDKSGLECDAVIVLPNGKYGLVQVKLGQTNDTIDHAAKTLLELSEKIDTEKMQEPSFKLLITGTGQVAYQRSEDGLYIVPIGCLGP